MAGPTRPSRCSLHGKRPAARRVGHHVRAGRGRPGTSWPSHLRWPMQQQQDHRPDRRDARLAVPSRRAGDWLVFHHVEGVSVYGGTVDGRGSSLWACKAAGRSCAAGASSLTFRNSKDITISGLTSTDSELYHIVIDGCDGVTVQNVKITAPGTAPTPTASTSRVEPRGRASIKTATTASPSAAHYYCGSSGGSFAMKDMGPQSKY
ncbi:unnamed protein product [Musa acuminata subsp. burmannicoides]